ncbi:hypothetical protein SAY86_015570 [Trapa natans]|uniref:C2H2-type domain-containing protein n=1 Tax=Trapa natans TaxID=22666 RepID=A0AAN7L3A5_TRANT|nr:hypothetical protein SAY86_015570 [Trapa natans]
MPTVWFALKRSLHCNWEPSDVHDLKTRRHLVAISTSRKWSSPRSIGSSEFLNPITHEVILGGNSKCELKITSFSGDGQQDFSLAPGTPMHCFNNPSFRVSSNTTNGGGALRRGSPPRSSGCSTGKGTSIIIRRCSWLGGLGGRRNGNRRISLDGDCHGNGVAITCHKCGEQFSKWEAAESHHLSKHADILPINYRFPCTVLYDSYSSNRACGRRLIAEDGRDYMQDGVGKVRAQHDKDRAGPQGPQHAEERFEEYRETVKIKASKLSKKHPKCLADWNELLRFYRTTLSCSLGLNGSSSLCVSEKCCVCRIVRNGFSARKELKDGIGVFTTSTSDRAFESIEICCCDQSYWDLS